MTESQLDTARYLSIQCSITTQLFKRVSNDMPVYDAILLPFDVKVSSVSSWMISTLAYVTAAFRMHVSSEDEDRHAEIRGSRGSLLLAAVY